MPDASTVTFDVLLGGKVTPALLKSFKDLEEMMKKQGATAKTINTIMGRAYKETFDEMGKSAKKGFEEVEKSSTHAFHHLVEEAREAQHKVKEAFHEMHEGANEFFELIKKPLEWLGISGLVGGLAATIGGKEIVAEAIKLRRERATEEEVLGATLRGRGRGAEAPGYAEAAEALAAHARVGHKEAMEMMTKLAASGKFKTAEEAQAMAMSLIGLGGGTAEGGAGSMAAYQRMMLTGKLSPKLIAALGRGSGINVLQQLSQDTGIPVADLQKQLGQAKINKKTGEIMGGALAGAKGIEALNKAILELGQGRGLELVKAQMSGMNGLFYRLGEHWEDFVAKIGEFIDEVISPLGDEINKWLDSIKFSDIFAEMVERGKELGQMIKAVWDTIANTPIINQVKKMWDDFWDHFLGGFYGPREAIRNVAGDIALKHGWHYGRHMTEAGHRMVQQIADTVSKYLKLITDAFQWFIDHGKDVWWWINKIIEGFILLKSVEVGLWITNLIKGVVALGVTAKEAAIAIGVSEGAGLVGALGLIPGAVAAVVTGVALLLKTTSKDPVRNKIADLRTKQAESQTTFSERQAELSRRWGEGSLSDEDYRKQLKELDDAHAKETKATEAQIKMQESLAKANKALEGSVKDLEGASKKAAGNDLLHFTLATEQATQAMLTLGQSMAGLGGGVAGFGGGPGPSGPHETEYGPAVSGDQPGQATYDYNSYHHIGAWPGVTGPLRVGDVALGYGAQAQYHVRPGDYFTTASGKRVRFADRSGSKDPYNIDFFKGALGGIFRKPTRALIGESGPEAVLPLQGVGATGLGAVTINVNVAGSANDPEAIASAVERVVREHYRRSAVV